MSSTSSSHAQNNTIPQSVAYEVVVSGTVQGVGYRPYIYHLALNYHLAGWVKNECGTVQIFIQGTQTNIEKFIYQIKADTKNYNASIDNISPAKPVQCSSFEIRQSTKNNVSGNVSLPKDFYVCSACFEELNSDLERRGGYSFIACSECGPRFSMVKAMPYDRATTSMSSFQMCETCQAEYDSPNDRRFHAQPICCPACGPELFCTSPGGRVIAQGDNEVLSLIVDYLNEGKIVALKSLGGYHLICDAQNIDAVDLLRQRKNRPDKPFAVMLPEPDPEQTCTNWLSWCAEHTHRDLKILSSRERPIVLMKKSKSAPLAENVAPMLSEIGLMYPCSALHYSILKQYARPIVATSGNESGEPLVTSTFSAQQKLSKMADILVHHNREIHNRLDDSVFRVSKFGVLPIRMGRGFAPLEKKLPFYVSEPVMAVGANQKNTISFAWENRLVTTPHIGDLDSPLMEEHFEATITTLQSLYHIQPSIVIRDAHPGYISSRWAKASGLPTRDVFHHHAHASAWALDAQVDSPSLVFVWDGTGLGQHNEWWGGEVFCGVPGDWQRVASLLPFKIQGGNLAAYQPWRSAAALAWTSENSSFKHPDGDFGGLSHRAWQNDLNCIWTSSMGRLFDAAAFACCGLNEVSFDGQAGLMLESLSGVPNDVKSLCFLENAKGMIHLDWLETAQALFDENIPPNTRAANFHATLIKTIWDLTCTLHEKLRFRQVGLAGGVFQNRILIDGLHAQFATSSVPLIVPQSLPLNDAAISIGQIHEHQAREER